MLWEDQERINTFSKLHSRMRVLRATLQKQEEEKEYLSDVEIELELLDDEESIQ